MIPKDEPKIIMNAHEKALRAALPRAVKPRVASTIVLLQGPKDNPRILMGQRAKRHDFMPSVYVFPGGRVDRCDSYMPYVGDLSPRTETILEAVYPPRRARAIVLATLRETWEETGLMLGRKARSPRNPKDPSWQAYVDADVLPDISGIEVFGRAITPPHRHKRFDTWFFINHLDEDTPPATADSQELLNVNWFTFDEIEVLNTHRATDMMLAVLKQYLSYDTAPQKIFFSRMKHGKYLQGDFPIED